MNTRHLRSRLRWLALMVILLLCGLGLWRMFDDSADTSLRGVAQENQSAVPNDELLAMLEHLERARPAVSEVGENASDANTNSEGTISGERPTNSTSVVDTTSKSQRTLLFTVTNENVNRVRWRRAGTDLSNPATLSPDAGGQYRIKDFPFDASGLTLWADDHLNLNVPIPQTDTLIIDLGVLTFRPLPLLIVTICDKHEAPVPGATLHLSPQRNERHNQLGPFISDEQGEARVTGFGVGFGKYAIQVFPPKQPEYAEYAITAASFTFSQDVALSHMRITLMSGGSVYARLDPHKIPSPELRWIKGYMYFLALGETTSSDNEKAFQYMREHTGQLAALDAEGGTLFTGVAEGRIFVCALDSKGDIYTSKSITVETGKDYVAEFNVARNAAIVGIARQGDGSTYANGNLGLFQAGQPTSTATTRTDDQGYFSFENLPAGDWVISAPSSFDGNAAYYKGASKGSPVTTYAGQTSRVEITIPKATFDGLHARLTLGNQRLFTTMNFFPCDNEGFFHIPSFRTNETSIALQFANEGNGAEAPRFLSLAATQAALSPGGILDVVLPASPLNVKIKTTDSIELSRCSLAISASGIGDGVSCPDGVSWSFSPQLTTGLHLQWKSAPHGTYQITLSHPERASRKLSFVHTGARSEEIEVGEAGGKLEVSVESIEWDQGAKSNAGITGWVFLSRSGSAENEESTFGPFPSSAKSYFTRPIAAGDWIAEIRFGDNYQVHRQLVTITSNTTTPITVAIRPSARLNLQVDLPEGIEIDDLLVEMTPESGGRPLTLNASRFKKGEGGTYSTTRRLGYSGNWKIRATLPGCKAIEVTLTAAMNESYAQTLHLKKE